MRHRVYGKHLGRDKNQRTALFKGLVQSLIVSEQIKTTESKAKAIKGLVDKLITQAKSPITRRLVSQFVTSKQAQEKLINDLLPRLSSRNSGYTSVVKLGRRLGDGAMMVQMSLLVEENKKEPKSAKKETDKKEAKDAEEAEVEEKEEKPKRAAAAVAAPKKGAKK